MKKEEIIKQQHYLQDRILTFIEKGEDPAYTLKEIIEGVHSTFYSVRNELWELRKTGKLKDLKLRRNILVWGVPGKIKKLTECDHYEKEAG